MNLEDILKYIRSANPNQLLQITSAIEKEEELLYKAETIQSFIWGKDKSQRSVEDFFRCLLKMDLIGTQFGPASLTLSEPSITYDYALNQFNSFFSGEQIRVYKRGGIWVSGDAKIYWYGDMNELVSLLKDLSPKTITEPDKPNILIACCVKFCTYTSDNKSESLEIRYSNKRSIQSLKSQGISVRQSPRIDSIINYITGITDSI